MNFEATRIQEALRKARLRGDRLSAAWLRIGLAYARDRGVRLSREEVACLVLLDTAAEAAIYEMLDDSEEP